MYLTETYDLKLRLMMWSVGRDLTASPKYLRPPSVTLSQLEKKGAIMYSNIHLQTKAEPEGVKCRKSLNCFTHVL